MPHASGGSGHARTTEQPRGRPNAHAWKRKRRTLLISTLIHILIAAWGSGVRARRAAVVVVVKGVAVGAHVPAARHAFNRRAVVEARSAITVEPVTLVWTRVVAVSVHERWHHKIVCANRESTAETNAPPGETGGGHV